MTHCCRILAIFAVLGSSSVDADVVTDWTGFTSDTATGELNGITITGTRIAGAPFANISTNSFSSPGNWNAPMPLPSGTEGIIVQPVNDGADHMFAFASPMASVSLYVSNFDSSSDAVLTADGTTSIEMIAATSTMFFDPISNSSGRLFTSNGGFDGNSDAVIRMTGAVQSLRLQYSDGIQNNGIGYTFTTVPEPGSFGLAFFAACLIGIRRVRC